MDTPSTSDEQIDPVNGEATAGREADGGSSTGTPPNGIAPDHRFSIVTKVRGTLARSGTRYRANWLALRAYLAARRDRHPRMREFRIRWGEFTLAALAAVALAALLLDAPVGSYQGQWPQIVSGTARTLTDFGKSGWMLVPTGLALFIAFGVDWTTVRLPRRIAAFQWLCVTAFVFISIGGAGLIATTVKRVIGRGRPMHFEDGGAFSFSPFSDASFASFPSGHSTNIGSLFAIIALLFPFLRVPCLIAALWMGFTRVAVGAHYPSDVIAGLAFGAWFAYMLALVFARYGLVFTIGDDGAPVVRRGFRPPWWPRRRAGRTSV